MMERVYIGLGSNLAEPRKQLHSALQAIAALPHTQLLGVSPFYLSDPLGPADQPRYVNAVAALDCALAPLELLDALQARAFVLYPLADLAPQLTLADGRQLSALLAACPFAGLQRLTSDDTNNSL